MTESTAPANSMGDGSAIQKIDPIMDFKNNKKKNLRDIINKKTIENKNTEK
jgi:hypothetical protein